jgi:hypothetical protein
LRRSQGLEQLIRRIAGASVAAQRESPSFFKEITRMSFNDAELKKRIGRINKKMKRVLEAGIMSLEKISESDAREITYVFFYAAGGIIHEMVMNPGEIDENRALNILARLFSNFIEKEFM